MIRIHPMTSLRIIDDSISFNWQGSIAYHQVLNYFATQELHLASDLGTELQVDNFFDDGFQW